MEQLIDFYNTETLISNLSLIAMLLAWVFGILVIIEGRRKRDVDQVKDALMILFFGSIPLLNGFVLGLFLVFGAAALVVAGLALTAEFISNKIVGENN